MSRLIAKARPIGGIGAMMAKSEICPGCGKVVDNALAPHLPEARWLPLPMKRALDR